MLDQIQSLFEIESFTTSIISTLPKLLGAAGILLIFWIFYRIIRNPSKRILKGINLEEALVRMLVDNVLRFTLFLFGLITALSHLGVDITAAIAGIGVIGIAVGFAAQDSLSNIIAGFLIFWDKPFQVRHWISIGDLYGEVVEITMRSTRIRTHDNTYIVIPNQKIINEVLTNHTKEGELRINMHVGIAYKESIDEARKVLLKAMKEIPEARKTPKPDVVVEKIADSSIDLAVRIWIDNAEDEVHVHHTGLEICKKALDEAGIQIPFPHRQLYVDAVDDEIWDQASKLKKG